MNLAMLLLLAWLTHATRSFSADGEPGSSGTSLALGYLLVSGYFAGRAVSGRGLPKLTGYLLIGALAGPAVLGLVSRPMVDSLSLVNGMAVAMIALTAGTELELRALKPLARTLVGITVFGILGTIAQLAAAVWLCRPLLPFFARFDTLQAIAVTVTLAVVLVAQSPAIVVALHSELRAEGPVARSVLGVVVLGDLLVIFLFALVSAVARSTFGAGADVLHTLSTIGWEIGGSFVVGAVVGALLILYLRKVKIDAALMLLLVTFTVAEIGGRLGLDPLLVALSAGALVRNASDVAEQLHAHLQVSSLPVYVLFFCLAGAGLHPGTLAIVWLPATLLSIVRGIGLLVGTRAGACFAGAPPAVQRYAGFGLLPQAGLAQALALLFGRTFPEFSTQAAALVLTVVAINVFVSPVLYRLALNRSGEVERAAKPGWSSDGANPSEAGP